MQKDERPPTALRLLIRRARFRSQRRPSDDSACLSSRGVPRTRDEKESCRALKILRARFLAALGMTFGMPIRAAPRRSRSAYLACAVWILWAAGSPLAAQLVAPGDEPYFEAYSRSDPITKWPLTKVRHQVPELKGLKPATVQSRLPEILRGVSANLEKFVVTFVDTTALETVDENGELAGGTVPVGLMPQRHIKQTFRYLMLARREGGAFTLVEYRTDLHGQEEHPQRRAMGFIKTTGFATMPLFFGPLEQPWSDFRYLGRQTIGGSATEVVAFAERPEPVAVMGHLVIGDASVPMLVQGVAWIRTSDYQILQMRTDLLAPLQRLKRVTTLVQLAENHLQDVPAALWLPQKVDVNVSLGDFHFSNRHRYSDYQMFRVKAVIRTDASPPPPH